MLLDVVEGAEPQQLLLLKPSVRQILHILQTGSWVREGNVIDRDTDAYCVKTVHLLNQVDEADLLQLMDEEEATQYIESTEPTEPVPEVTEPEPVVVAPKPEEKEKTSQLPLIGVLLIAGIGGGAFFLMKSKSKQKEAAKTDPDADYVDDDEDFGYVEEDEDMDFTDTSEYTEPI